MTDQKTEQVELIVRGFLQSTDMVRWRDQLTESEAALVKTLTYTYDPDTRKSKVDIPVALKENALEFFREKGFEIKEAT